MLLLAWFASALRHPFDHPRVYIAHLIPTLESERDRPLELPPVPFQSRNLAEFDVLRPALAETVSENGLPRLRVSPGRGLDDLAGRLQALGTEESDVLVLYVSAHGVSYDGRAYLTWGEFPSGDPASSILVAELLQAVASQDARTKLILFDVGHVTSAPELGMLVNDFSRLLATELRTLNDDAVWAFVSNATFQGSSFSPSTRRSRFTEFVVRGLVGDADEDGDAVVDLGELERYVIREVGSRVDNSSGGATRQTPMLLRSGTSSSPNGEMPTIISVATLQSVTTPVGSASAPKDSTTGDEDVANTPDTAAGSDAGGNSSPGGSGGMPGAPSEPRDGSSSAEKVAKAPAADAPAASGLVPNGGPSEAEDGSTGRSPSANGPSRPESPRTTPQPKQSLPQPTSPATLATAVDSAFRLRDDLVDWSSPSLTPFEVAPHTWRRLELELLRLEQQAHFASYHPAQGDAVRRLTTTLRSLLADRSSTTVDFGPGRFPRLPLVTVDDPTTLGMQELFDQPATAASKPALLPTVYDGLLDSTSFDEFRAGLAKLGPAADRCAEVRLARRLVGASVDWSTTRRILRVQRFGERVAARSTWGHEWIVGDVALADSLLDEVVRLVTTEPWRVRAVDAERLLDQANTAYGRADRTQDDLERAKRVQARAAYVLPPLLAYGFSDLAAEASTRDLVDELVMAFEELDELTSSRRQENREQIDTKAAELLAILERADSALNGDDLVRSDRDADTPPVVPGDVQRALRLLATPYAAASRRREMWADAVAADERLERLLGRIPTIRHSPSEPPASRRRRAQFTRRAAAEVRVARLTTPSSDDRLSQLDATAKSIVERHPATGDVELDWDSTASFGRLLRDYQRAQKTRIAAMLTSQTDGVERIDDLRRAWLGSALMDSRTVGGSNQWTITTQLAVAETYEFLDWHRRRLVGRLVDAPAAERQSLDDDLLRVARMAASLPGRRTLPPSVGSTFTAEGTSVIELVTRVQGEMTVRVQNGDTKPQAVSLLLDFDAGLVRVTPRDDLAVSSAAHLQKLGVSRVGSRVALPPGLRPAFVLEPGETKEIDFDVRRVGTAPTSANVVFRALTATHVARHDTTVAVPHPVTTALEFSGPFDVRPVAGTLEVRAFPNRQTAYAAEVRSLVDVDDTLQVALHAPGRAVTLPDYSLSKREAAAVVADMRSRVLGAVTKVKLPARGVTRVAFTAPKTAGAGGPTQTPAPAASTTKVAGRSAADALPHGLVVVVESSSGRVSFHPISVAVLHPRGFVRASAEFDAKLRRLHARFVVTDDRFLPEGGLAVRGATDPTLPDSTLQHFVATIDRDSGEADLFLNVPENLSGALEFGVDVGGYPRAFRFRLGPELETGPVAVDVTRPRARLNSPSDGAAFAPSGRVIPLRLSADLPTSRGSTARFVEVGFDTNRDRRFGPNEATKRLMIDRSVQVLWGGFDALGRLQLASNVTDLTVSLTPPAVSNGRVNLLAHAVGGGRESWSVPHEVVFDGTPPSVSKVEIGPSAAVAPGTALTVSVEADDGALSGVASVRVGFDDGTGQFAKKPPVTAAMMGEAGRWQATVPTKGLETGGYRVLVEATDHAGNVSEPLSASVRLATAGELEKLARSKAVDVGGRVSFGGDPVADVTVSLAPENGKPLPSVTTDENGRFRLPAVPPGTYELQAKGVSRNKIRTLTQKLVVPVNGSGLPDLDLKLPR